MTDRPENPPAFPNDGFDNGPGNMRGRPAPGMSLRDWFAGMALQGMLGGGFRVKDDGDEATIRATAPIYAENAYVLADAMLAARGRT